MSGESATHTRESGEPPKDVRLCFLFRADQLPGAEEWVANAIAQVIQAENREVRARGGVRDHRVNTFTVSGRPAVREPEQTWFEVSPEALRFSAQNTPDFAAKLQLAVRKWGTGTYFLDLPARKIENWTQRRQENTRVLLDRVKDLVLFEPVLLQGQWISVEELTKDWPALKAAVLAAHAQNLADLREMYPEHWALLNGATYPEWPHGTVGYPGTNVYGVYPTAREVETAAVKHGRQCWVVNIATGEFSQRWYDR